MQYASVLCGLALALRDQGSHDKSLKVFEQMGKVHDNSEIAIDTVDHANHYKSWGTVLAKFQRYSDAHEQLSRARTIFESISKTQVRDFAVAALCALSLSQSL